jgi:hypothetical protein
MAREEEIKKKILSSDISREAYRESALAKKNAESVDD